MFVNEHARAVANQLLLDLQNPFPLQHDGQDVTGGRVLGIILLNQLPQQRLGGLFLNRFRHRRRAFIDTLPMRNEPAPVLRIGKLALPAGGANIRAPELRFLFQQQCVIRFFVRERLAAHFTAVAARLYIPLGNQALKT